LAENGHVSLKEVYTDGTGLSFREIKCNHHFKLHRLEGLEKDEIEVGLACLVHNLRKKAYKDTQTTENVENNANKHPKKRKSMNLGS